MRTATYKVPGGKLIKVKLSLKDDRIDEVIITGDFFLHPEYCIGEIESALTGSKMDSSELLARVDKALHSNAAQLIGASASDIVHAILSAVE